jgi:hypothetical protein
VKSRFTNYFIAGSTKKKFQNKMATNRQGHMKKNIKNSNFKENLSWQSL